MRKIGKDSRVSPAVGIKLVTLRYSYIGRQNIVVSNGTVLTVANEGTRGTAGTVDVVTSNNLIITGCYFTLDKSPRVRLAYKNEGYIQYEYD